MSLWIHVQKADKLPIKRGSSSTPFEEFASDPNPNYQHPDYEFLPVITDYTEPAYNPVQQFLRKFTTVGVDGTYEGHHVAPNWRQEWEIVTRTLAQAKAAQLDRLQDDYQTRLEQGYLDSRAGGSNKLFTLDEISFGALDHKHGWFVQAQADGVIPAGRKASVFAADSTRVQFNNLAQFRGFYDNYGLTWDNINEHYYEKGDAIANANSIGQVVAVTWNFNAF